LKKQFFSPQNIFLGNFLRKGLTPPRSSVRLDRENKACGVIYARVAFFLEKNMGVAIFGLDGRFFSSFASGHTAGCHGYRKRDFQNAVTFNYRRGRFSKFSLINVR